MIKRINDLKAGLISNNTEKTCFVRDITSLIIIPINSITNSKPIKKKKKGKKKKKEQKEKLGTNRYNEEVRDYLGRTCIVFPFFNLDILYDNYNLLAPCSSKFNECPPCIFPKKCRTSKLNLIVRGSLKKKINKYNDNRETNFFIKCEHNRTQIVRLH